MLRQVDPIGALKAGLLATLVMTIIMYALPLIGLPAMDIMAALGSVFPLKISPYLPGAIVHFGIGTALAIIYAALFYSWLPGPAWLRGTLFSLLPWLFAITLLGPSLQLASNIFGASPPSATNPCAAIAPANPCAPKALNPCAPKAAANPCAPKTANPCAPGAGSQASIPPQALSLVVHLIYGGIVGALYRPKI